MKTRLLISLVLLIAALPALTADPVPDPLADRPDRPPASRPPSPMMIEIQKVVSQDRAETDVLQARFRAATEEEEAIRIQREIEDLVRNTELKILQVQADFARKDGREEQAREIEGYIEKMRNPVRRGAPGERPAPTHHN